MAEAGPFSAGRYGSRRVALVAAFLVALVSFLIYLPALRSTFVNWDDNLYIYQNPFVRTLDATFLRQAIFGFHASNWHPVTWLSHALDCALWGLNPLGHHLTSLLLHAVNAFLVVLLVVRLGSFPGWRSGAEGNAPAAGGRPVLVSAVLTGLLFGLHPLHVESVMWISERKDVLCALFFLLALCRYAAYAAAAGAGIAADSRFLRDRRYLGSLALFALALMSKPMAISLPAVLLVLDWCPFGRVRTWKALGNAAAEKLPFVLLSLPSAALTVLAQRSGAALVPLEEIPFAERSVVAVRSFGQYIGKMLLPIHLVPYYPYPQKAALFSVETLLLVTLAIGATAAAVVAAQRGRRLWLAAWGWYALTLAPVLGFVQVGRQAMADRYTYLPSLGPFLAAGAALAWTWGRVDALRMWRLAARGTGAATVVAVLLTLATLTVRQTAIWKDSVNLWSAVIGRVPVPLAFFFYNRAIAYRESGRVSEAIDDYGRAIALDPGDERTWVNRGLLYVQTGRPGPAAADFTAACALGNDFGCKAAQFYGTRAASGGNRP